MTGCLKRHLPRGFLYVDVMGFPAVLHLLPDPHAAVALRDS